MKKIPGLKFRDQKFFEGDILQVRAYDQGEEQWQEGITEVVGATNTEGAPHIDRGYYSLKRLTGNFTAVSYNADFFEDPAHVQVICLGNAYLKPSIRSKYGKSRKNK